MGLEASIAAGEIAPVYVLHSASPLLVSRAVAALRAAVVPDEAVRAWACDVFEGKGTSAAEILAAAETVSMMSERRLVHVRDLAVIPADELGKLIEYLKSPNPRTVLVCVTTKLDKRMKFYAAAKKAGFLHDLQVPKRLASFIAAEADRAGVAMSGAARSRLADVVGKDLSRVVVALEQLSLYAGDRRVEVDDVDDLIADTRERSVFELTDSLAAGDLARALAAASALCDQRQSGIGVTAMLARHMRQVALCKEAMAARRGKSELARICGVPPFAVGRLQKHAGRLDDEQIAAGAAALLETDAALKGMAPLSRTLGRQLGERMLLERLVRILIGSREAAPRYRLRKRRHARK